MQYISPNLYFFTISNTNKSVLSIVTVTQLLNVELTIPFIEGVIEVSGILLVYGANNYCLIQFVNINNIIEPKLLSTEVFYDINSFNSNVSIKSMVYYEEKKLFISGHSNGELCAWNPGSTNLVRLENIKISDSVRNRNLIYLKYI